MVIHAVKLRPVLSQDMTAEDLRALPGAASMRKWLVLMLARPKERHRLSAASTS